MCWADKLALCIWALVCLALFGLSHSPNSDPMTPSIIPELLITLAAIWLPLRMIDWIIGGPRRRG